MEIVHNFVLRIARARLARASKEAQQRAAGSEHADQLGCEQPGRLTIQIVDQVPAENPVDACVRPPATNLQDLCDRCRLCSALPGEAVEIREEILDKTLTPEPLTEKSDVRLNDRSQIQQDRRDWRGMCAGPWWEGRERLPAPLPQRSTTELTRGGAPPAEKQNRRWRGPFRRPTKPLLTSPAPEPTERLQVSGLGSFPDARAPSAAPRPVLRVGPACSRLSPRPPAGYRACVAYRCSPENARPQQWPLVAR